jgi:predicted peptidase
VKDYKEADQTNEVSTENPLSGLNSLAVHIRSGGTAADDIVVYQSLTIQQGRFYQITVMANSSKSMTIQAVFQENTGENGEIWSSGEIQVTENTSGLGPFEFHSLEPDISSRFMIKMGGMDDVIVLIDAVQITITDDPDHFRPEEKFEKREYAYEGLVMSYRLARPDSYDLNEKYPLVLTLHGSGSPGKRMMLIW